MSKNSSNLKEIKARLEKIQDNLDDKRTTFGDFKSDNSTKKEIKKEEFLKQP